jgi:tetratricopeptide (TPR) repeat protein
MFAQFFPEKRLRRLRKLKRYLKSLHRKGKNMALNIRNLAEQLEISDRGLNDLKRQIVKSFDDEKIVRDILSRQLSDREETHCLSCDNEGDCFILNGIIHLRLKENKKAIKELKNANWHLRTKNETWNSITGLVLLGIALEEGGKYHLALHEYKKAYEILINNFLRIHVYDQIEKASQLKNELLDKLKELSAPNFSTAPLSETDTENINSNISSIDDKDYLALFSIPIFGSVEAGPDGIFHNVDPHDTFTIINNIEFQGQAFNVHNIHGAASIDRQITVTTTRDHGWLRVHGLSMNGWDISFNENDYVLFYKAPVASHLDYVIASNRDPSGELALMVKRFDKNNNQLRSKSKDTSKSYDPIPLDEDHQIVGVVIAVAKPAK